MGAMTSQIPSLTIVYSTVYSDADQEKHQSSASLAFVWGIQRWPVNSLHKKPVTRKMFPFHYVIMIFMFWVMWSAYHINSAYCTNSSYEIALRWIFVDKPTLVQVMAWCWQASSHYLNQFWPTSISPYGFTRSQWVEIQMNILFHSKFSGVLGLQIVICLKNAREIESCVIPSPKFVFK